MSTDVLGVVLVFLVFLVFLVLGWKILLFIIKSIFKVSSQAVEDGKLKAREKHFTNKRY